MKPLKLKTALLGLAGGALAATGLWWIMKARGGGEPPPEPKYYLYLDAGAGGTTDPAPGTHEYALDTVVTITAIPAGGYVFDYFTVDGIVRTLNPWSATMNAAHSVVAYFKVAGSNKYTLKISATQGGTTDPSPGNYEFDPGASVMITATPAANYQFASWIVDNDTDNPATENPIILTMNASHVVLANFLTNVPQNNVTLKAVDEYGAVVGAQIFLDGNLVGSGQVTLTGVTYGTHTVTWGPQVGYQKPADSTFLNEGWYDKLVVGQYVHSTSPTYVLGVTVNIYSTISKIKIPDIEDTVYVKKDDMNGPVIASALTDTNGFCSFNLVAGSYYAYCPSVYGTIGQQVTLPPALSIEILFITGGFKR